MNLKFKNNLPEGLNHLCIKRDIHDLALFHSGGDDGRSVNVHDDGTIEFGSVQMFIPYILSDLWKGGWEECGWYDVIRSDLHVEHVPMVAWEGENGRRFGIFRSDKRKIVLVHGPSDLSEVGAEHYYRAVMQFPWGPSGIGHRPTVYTQGKIVL